MFNEFVSLVSRHVLGDIAVLYVKDEQTGSVGMCILPAGLEETIPPSRKYLPETSVEMLNLFMKDVRADYVQNLVQLKCEGDDYPGGFSQGRTMCSSQTVAELKYTDQQVRCEKDETVITTTLEVQGRFNCEHILKWRKGQQALRVSVVFHNISRQVEKLEMLSSFSLWGISPFDEADCSARLKLHRFRSNWSAEAKPDQAMFEDLHLERTWVGHGVICERFGQAGSLPVRDFFPFAAIEDVKNSVCWGARLAEPGSWQLEVHKTYDKACLSGGAADMELGHWLKEVKPGESLKTREAHISVCTGTVEQLCTRLNSVLQSPLANMPAIEKDMPVVFNEWCTSWGNPSQQALVKAADRIKDTGMKYFVIDAGWYRQGSAPWDKAQGDWKVCDEFFPGGLKAAADAIRERGLVPGLWFEFEVVGRQSEARNMTDHFLKRNGNVIVSGDRMFWDFRDPFVIDYLNDKVIKTLRDCGFGYLKIDYNETIGIGADGAESPGQAMRRHLECVQEFIRSIRREIPEIVIEICSSGGHRLEPSMMELCSMVSFSDAHETVEIPIIAASLHNLVIRQQLQIWCVVRKTDDMNRLVYSLSSLFLGRACLSGDIYDIDQANWQKICQALELYEKVKHIIRDGVSKRCGDIQQSWRHPAGVQAVMMVSPDNTEAIIVAHRFAKASDRVNVDLPADDLKIKSILSSSDTDASVHDRKFTCTLKEQFTACVVHLGK